MTAISAIPFPVGEESEVVERRASAWSDPRTWVSICGILLTVCTLVGGMIASQLSSLSAKMENLLIVTTKQTSDFDALRAKETADNEALKDTVKAMREEIGALREHDAAQERVIAEIHGATMKKGR